MDTKESILSTALELFNRDGTGAVSTNHIARELGISPGNLYYYFRNKGEVIRALFERFFAAWEQALVFDETRAPTLENLQELMRANFRALWDFRFTYRELVVLLRQDEQLMQRWLEVRGRGFEQFRALFERFVEAGVLTGAAGPAAVDEIAEICGVIAGFWLASVEAAGREVDEAAIEEGVRLVLRVLRVRRFRLGAETGAD